MRKKILTIVLTIALSSFVLAQEDAEGCKDHPMFNRLSNFHIFDCSENYNEVNLHTSAENTIAKEGNVFKIGYGFNYESGAKCPSTLQVIKNYENAVLKNGGKKIYSSTEKGVATFTMTAKDIEYWVMIEQTSGDRDNCEEFYLYVIEIKSMKQEIQANEMFETLNKDGFIALYINFETGKAEIRPESQKIIDQIVQMLKENPDLKISIEGHTDNVGTAEFNQKLSENRAKAVMDAIIAQNIDKNRLSSKGWGATKPVADNNTEEGKAKNRRVEIVKK
jgi:hypothetical protein